MKSSVEQTSCLKFERTSAGSVQKDVVLTFSQRKVLLDIAVERSFFLPTCKPLKKGQMVGVHHLLAANIGKCEAA